MWRQDLEDKYTVICKKCKAGFVDSNKKPAQKYYKKKCCHCGFDPKKEKK